MDASTVMLIGLAFNFVTMVVGGVGLLFAIWRYSVSMAERMATMEAHIRHLMQAQGLTIRKGDDHAIHG
jgi:hypothetical protein